MRLLILILLTTVAPQILGSNQPFIRVRFLYNYDGDTFTVNLSSSYVPDVFSKEISVRIKGIDTAEMTSKEPCAKEMAIKAKNYAYDMLRKAKRIDLLNVERDKYFRILADVILYESQVKKINLGQRLLIEKLALPYDGNTKFKGSWCPFLKSK